MARLLCEKFLCLANEAGSALLLDFVLRNKTGFLGLDDLGARSRTGFGGSACLVSMCPGSDAASCCTCGAPQRAWTS